MLMQAQFWGGGISKKAQQQLIEQEKADNHVVYVNTKAPGIHKVYDKERGYEVWKDGMGNFLCADKNMKPLEAMDENVYYTGQNNNPDNPKAPDGGWVKKEWDKDRGCYVWKAMPEGSFLGRDKPSIDKQKEWLQQKDKGWLAKGNVPVGKKPGSKTSTPTAAPKSQGTSAGTSTGASAGASRDPEDEEDYIDAGGYDGEVPENFDPRTLVITTDAQMRQAEAALAEARAAIRQAQAMGVNVSDYADLSAIDLLEQKINEYKRKRSQMK